jgi:hypothetical protein
MDYRKNFPAQSAPERAYHVNVSIALYPLHPPRRTHRKRPIPSEWSPQDKEIDMNHSPPRTLVGTAAVLAASAAGFVAAVAITTVSPVFAASSDYRFELVQAAAPACPGKSDVTVRLVRTADGRTVANAEISAATAISSVAEPTGSRRFRVETATVGPQTLQVSAKVPGATRVERTFNSSVKFMQERTIRGASEMVTGAVTFDARRGGSRDCEHGSTASP